MIKYLVKHDIPHILLSACTVKDTNKGRECFKNN